MNALIAWIAGLGAIGPVVAGISVLAVFHFRHITTCVKAQARTDAKIDSLVEGQAEIKASVRSIEEHLRK